MLLVLAGLAAFTAWRPGTSQRDGAHDLRRNGLWLAHGWLGGDSWFTRHGKGAELERYRSAAAITLLRARLARGHVTDVFPHLCPAEPEGRLPDVDAVQTERVLDALEGVRVFPWIGGPNADFPLSDEGWVTRYLASVRALLAAHPRLAGVHLNVEPMPSGNAGFLTFLERLRAVLPPGKLLSVAAYPPPTAWQPAAEVHWEEAYSRAVAQRADQVVPMLYDTSIRFEKPYVALMARWTRETLAWSEGRPVLLGLPAYDDSGVGYHHADVENLRSALAGVHAGLGDGRLPPTYQGVALYSDWEIDEAEWRLFADEFLSP